MGARILSFLLGMMLAGFGWAIVDPAGLAGTKLPPIDLGMLEGHRVFIGWGVLALGIASLLSAVLPKGRSGKPRLAGPPLADFDAAPEAPADHGDHGSHADHGDHGHHHGHGEAHPVMNSGSPRPSALW